MNTSLDHLNTLSSISLARALMLVTAFVMMFGGQSWAESAASSSVKKPKDESAAETSATDASSEQNAEEGAEADSEISEPALITDPMKMRFRISKVDRGISSESRLFVAPRVITLTAIGPVAHLTESVWRGKRLAVFHKFPVYSKDTVIGMTEEKVGTIKIQSVYQSTLQAVVALDDITRGLKARKGAIRVVMLGDIARLERPIKAPPKPKVKRYVKPKKRSPYERDDMRWRL